MDYKLITDNDIDAVAKMLRDLIPGWIKMMADKIDADKHWKTYSGKKCTDIVVNNIAAKNIKSQLHRRLFMKYAKELLEPTITAQKEGTSAGDELVAVSAGINANN